MSDAARPIVHIVAWRLNGASADERAAQARRVIAAFEHARPRVPGLLRMDVGANAIAAADAWDVALCMVFASRADLDAYQAHPDHLAVKALVAPLRAARAQVDFETG